MCTNYSDHCFLLYAFPMWKNGTDVSLCPQSLLSQHSSQSCVPAGDALIIAPWPAKSSPVDAEAVSGFELVKSVVKAVRNARVEYNVEVSNKISATLMVSDSRAAAVLREELPVGGGDGAVVLSGGAYLGTKVSLSQKLNIGSTYFQASVQSDAQTFTDQRTTSLSSYPLKVELCRPHCVFRCRLKRQPEAGINYQCENLKAAWSVPLFHFVAGALLLCGCEPCRIAKFLGQEFWICGKLRAVGQSDQRSAKERMRMFLTQEFALCCHRSPVWFRCFDVSTHASPCSPHGSVPSHFAH